MYKMYHILKKRKMINKTTEVLAIYKRITHGNKFIATYSHCQCVCFSLRAVFGAACVTQKKPWKTKKWGEWEKVGGKIKGFQTICVKWYVPYVFTLALNHALHSHLFLSDFRHLSLVSAYHFFCLTLPAFCVWCGVALVSSPSSQCVQVQHT